jgi:hypothetical protein
MRIDSFGFAVAIALCAAAVSVTDAKAADGRGRYWGSCYSHSFRHGAFHHVHSGSVSNLTLTFGNGAAAGGLATTIAADGPISTATLPKAVTFSAAVNNQGKSVSADGSGGLV